MVRSSPSTGGRRRTSLERSAERLANRKTQRLLEAAKAPPMRLGMVDQVFGDESHVRKVLVRTADRKEFLRDRTKVVRLELDPVRGSAASFS